MNPIRWQQLERVKSGSVLVLVCVFIIALFAFAALSIDVSYVLQQQRNLQSGTDAAALAAVVLLTNSTVNAGSVTAEAENIAAANGVTAAEIISNGVQLGRWVVTATSTGFVATTPYNAVSVSAKRIVTMNFAQLVGMTAMSPAVTSIATMSIAGSAIGEGGGGLIPFAFHPAQATNTFYVPYTFTKKNIGSGNFGKLDLGSIDGNMSWSDAMQQGCNCTITIGQFYGDVSGNADIGDTFYNRWQTNPYVTMAVFAPLGPGNAGGGEVIIGFVQVLITGVTKGGNWSVTAENVPGFIDGGGGGTGTGGGTNYVRNLVQ